MYDPKNQPHDMLDELLNQLTLSGPILNSIGDAISIQNLNFRVLFQNEAHKKLFGEHTGEMCYSAYLQKQTVCEDCPVALVFADGGSHTVITTGISKHRTIRVEIAASPIKNSRGEIVAGMAKTRDITSRQEMEDELTSYRSQLEQMVEERTEALRALNEELELDIRERRKIEEALRNSRAFVRNIFESVGEGLIVIDSTYRIISANRAFLSLTKQTIEKTIGRRCHEISHHSPEPCYLAGEDCPSQKTFETGEPQEALHVHKLADGSNAYVEVRSYPMKDESGTTVSVIETINDVTSRRRLEEQLRNAQKLEAVGQLAGGIAHDFNNILTAIIGYGNLLQMNVSEDDVLRSKIDHIVTAAEKAATLTRSLLTYSRQQLINTRPVSLNEIITGVEKLLSRLISEDIDLQIVLTPAETIINADAGQLEQVLMNLVTNARDAMPEGGVLEIKTETTELTADFVSAHSFGRPGKYIVLSVSDAGTGIDDRIRSKIFDPFFTTKEVGKGTGLGLAMVYGIMKQHGGFIDITSSSTKGTTFNLYLPASGPVEIKKLTPATEASSEIRGGSETILLAEDDEVIRTLSQKILEKAGYTVLATMDGAQAVEEYIQHRASIDLLLLDVVMPKKNGKVVYDEIRAMDPSVKTLFFSGHTADLLHHEGKLNAELNFIRKPLSVNELLLKVREVLDKQKRS
ncbi:MAG: hybrid sensor histidine kinase/response regulator [Thermodesulfovibrio sp.]|nr:hybrid sensor histidine kinase/response regulator [Thermodesulfovibrio sp.]